MELAAVEEAVAVGGFGVWGLISGIRGRLSLSIGFGGLLTLWVVLEYVEIAVAVGDYNVQLVAVWEEVCG